ncbi:MAG: urease accessory protein UreD, partial [Deltaproteobacteria bacterium]|nr:urease accessory protein UreD [Deltaproteobacteria bacterium]
LLVFGRLAHGEIFKRGYLLDSWKVVRNGQLVWTDALRLDGDATAVMTEPAGFGGAVSMATFIYVAGDACLQLEAARDLLAGCETRYGVSCVNGILIARFLSPHPSALRVDYGRFWAGIRERVSGLPPNLPRIWHT